jgi:hypothetical protein
MGIKSTIVLSYSQAIEKFVQLRFEQERKQYETEAFSFRAKELEEELEKLNDLMSNGEGFENYVIEDAPPF